jgi:hypothetical protein
MQLATFNAELQRRFVEAEARGMTVLQLNAGEIHRALGGYPGRNHAMPTCCAAMYVVQSGADRVVSAPPSGKGASLTIAYALPWKLE